MDFLRHNHLEKCEKKGVARIWMAPVKFKDLDVTQVHSIVKGIREDRVGERRSRSRGRSRRSRSRDRKRRSRSSRRSRERDKKPRLDDRDLELSDRLKRMSEGVGGEVKKEREGGLLGRGGR